MTMVLEMCEIDQQCRKETMAELRGQDDNGLTPCDQDDNGAPDLVDPDELCNQVSENLKVTTKGFWKED